MESHGIGQSGAKKIKWAVILIQNTLINFFIQYRRPRYLFFLYFCGCCTALVYLLKENSYNNLRAWNFLVLLLLKTSHLSWEFCSHSPNVPETFFFFFIGFLFQRSWLVLVICKCCQSLATTVLESCVFLLSSSCITEI